MEEQKSNTPTKRVVEFLLLITIICGAAGTALYKYSVNQAALKSGIPGNTAAQPAANLGTATQAEAAKAPVALPAGPGFKITFNAAANPNIDKPIYKDVFVSGDDAKLKAFRAALQIVQNCPISGDCLSKEDQATVAMIMTLNDTKNYKFTYTLNDPNDTNYLHLLEKNHWVTNGPSHINDLSKDRRIASITELDSAGRTVKEWKTGGDMVAEWLKVDKPTIDSLIAKLNHSDPKQRITIDQVHPLYIAWAIDFLGAGLGITRKYDRTNLNLDDLYKIGTGFLGVPKSYRMYQGGKGGTSVGALPGLEDLVAYIVWETGSNSQSVIYTVVLKNPEAVAADALMAQLENDLPYLRSLQSGSRITVGDGNRPWNVQSEKSKPSYTASAGGVITGSLRPTVTHVAAQTKQYRPGTKLKT